MNKPHDTIQRQWLLLRNLPKQPQQMTVKQLKDKLADEQITVSERTIQRDLQDLSLHFPLVADEDEKPYKWYWPKDAKALDLPRLTIDEALTWVMVEQHLQHMLPTSATEQLKPYFKSARYRLNSEPQPRWGQSWLNKIRTVPPTQPLIAPHIDEEVQRTVSEALMHEQQLHIQYRRKGEAECKTYQIHPLALIQRGCILYLFARLFDYPNARLLALHRIEAASLLADAQAETPPGFDLDHELANGRLDFGAGQQITVRLRFYDGKGEHLSETPLSPNQQIEKDTAPNTLTISASVAETPQLKWWLLGFGDSVEVLTPEKLRHELSQAAAKMHARYSQTATEPA